MNKSKREAARAHYEQRSQARVTQIKNAAAIAAQWQDATQKALQRPSPLAKGRVERFLNGERDPVLSEVLLKHRTSVFFEIARTVEDRAPRLFDGPYLKVLGWISEIPLVRPVSDWKPRGKSRDTLFLSLAEHLLAKYPTPSIIWSALFDPQVEVLVPLVWYVSSGRSLYDYIKSGAFPVPLTRRMCHELLATSSEHGFMSAVRRVQIRAAGGSRELWQAYMTTRVAQGLGSKEDEAFWVTVIDWFSKNALVNPREVGPLVDYIQFRYWGDPTFSMKGRSVLAMLRSMREWHGNLVKEKDLKFMAFKPSGFRQATYTDYSRKEPGGAVVNETWRVRELLSNKELLDEGRRMGHCVYSYSTMVATRDISLWSMTMEDGEGETGNWAMLTIEVRNTPRQIVQARGRYNRMPTHRESTVLIRWANQNNLTVNLGRW